MRRKLPEILIEAGFMVLAILLALAADEWRDERQNREVADRALQGLAAEMRSNLAELGGSREHNQTVFADVRTAAQDAPELESLSVRYEYVLVSDAAWQTAQVTQAIHYVDYELVQRIALLYDLQDLFEQAQLRLVDQMSGMPVLDSQSVESVARFLLPPFTVVMDTEAGLSGALEDMIEVMENR